MNIAIFGLAISSSWGNGHATTYRALCKGLHQRGHRVTFFERDAEWYRSNRDQIPEYVTFVAYADWPAIAPTARRVLAETDVALVGSYFPDGQQAIDAMLESDVEVKAFYDIDTPITVQELKASGEATYLRADQLSALDLYLSFTGGPLLEDIRTRFRPRLAVPLYCAVDPADHYRTPRDARLACDLSYMGTYAGDRQPKLQELLSKPAEMLPQQDFIVAGPMYPAEIAWPRNVERIMHLEPKYHRCLYSSSRLCLNVTRREMVLAGYSPSVRLFEAAACGAAIVSDPWPGIETFFQPGHELLLATRAEEVKHYLTGIDARELRAIGAAAQARVLTEHSHVARAAEFEAYVEAANREETGATARLAG